MSYMFAEPCRSSDRSASAAGTAVLEQEVFTAAPANSLIKVAEVDWTVPPMPGACYRIDFKLADSTRTLSANEYRIAVQGAPPHHLWRGWLLSPDSSPRAATGMR